MLSKDGNYVIIKKRFNLVRFSKEKLVLEEYANLEKGILFSVLDFSVHISDKKLQWILRNFIQKGEILMVFPNIYYKVQMNKFFPERILSPDIQLALKILSKRTGEKFQEHGGVSAHRLGLSTQVPVIDVFYTNKNSREFHYFGHTVRLIKTRCHDVFQYPHERVGWVISALYQCGPNAVDQQLLMKLKKELTKEEYEKLLKAKKPSWLAKLIEKL